MLRNNDGEHGDSTKLALMMQEYASYKDFAGMSVFYNHSAGPAMNFSEFFNWDHQGLKYIPINIPNFYVWDFYRVY